MASSSRCVSANTHLDSLRNITLSGVEFTTRSSMISSRV